MFPKFPSVLRVIDRSDRNPPITATSVTFRPSLRHDSGLWLVDFDPMRRWHVWLTEILETFPREFFCVIYLYLNVLIGYVDVSDFNETWRKSSSNISAPKRGRLLRKSKYFSCDFPVSNSNHNIFYCSTLKRISWGTNSCYVTWATRGNRIKKSL